MNTIRIDTFPISTNNMYFGRRIMTPKAREAKEAIGWEARAAYDGNLYTIPCRVHIDIYYPNRRRRDLDNIKMLLDALTGVVWEDDSLIDDLRIRRHISAHNPRIMILVDKV